MSTPSYGGSFGHTIKADVANLALDLLGFTLVGVGGCNLDGSKSQQVLVDRNKETGKSGAALTVSAGAPRSGETNRGGGDLVLAGGASTGGVDGGDVLIQTTHRGSSGTQDNSPTTLIRARGNGNLIFGGGSIPADGTEGFVYIPAGAGAPTGAPEALTGHVALYFDTTSSKLHVHNGTAWKAYSADT